MKSISRTSTVLFMLAMLTLALVKPASAAQIGNGLAGLWEITGTPDAGGCGPQDPFMNVVSIGADGTFTNVDPVVGTGVGEVFRIGPNEFGAGFFGYISVGPGPLLRYEVQGELARTNGGEFAGKFRTILTLAETGTEVCTYEGTIAGSRLVAMPY